MECEKAYDGVINNSNGWACVKGDQTTVIFTLEKASAVNRVGIKFSNANLHAVAKKFQILLKKGDKWLEPNVRVEGFSSGITHGSVVELDWASRSVDVGFARETGVTDVNITVFEAFSGDGNSIFSEVFVQNVPEGNCTTVGGLQPNRQCIFPFINKWSNAVHYTCTTDQGFPPWCATRVNNARKMYDWDYIGFCNQSCEVEELSTCYATNSEEDVKAYKDKKNKERRTCIFPFLLSEKFTKEVNLPKDKWYNECVRNKHNIPVCATTVDKDGRMIDKGFCGPECPNSQVASQCIAASGSTGMGTRCVFPSEWEGKTILECTGSGWCPTAVKINGDKIDNEWGICHGKDSCDKNECITVGGARTGEACRFPFRNPWTNEMHHACTTARLDEEVGSSKQYASAPWCAVDTDVQDNMIEHAWGFCSKKCPVEKENNCYAEVTTGFDLKDMNRCIFPFKFKNMTYRQCAFLDGILKCPIEVAKDGVADVKHMRPCGPSPSCYNASTIAGNAITEGTIPVGSYTNNGTKDLEVVFSFETGIEDSTEKNWAVEASVTAGFTAYGVSVEASVTAGGGGGSSSSSSSQQSHSLTYKVPPQTKVVLNQQVLTSGIFEARTFRLILVQTNLTAPREEATTRTLLTDLDNLQSRIL